MPNGKPSLRTPLFPDNPKDLTIAQGNTGDCYLLAAADAIIKNPCTFNKLKSMFKQTDEGIEIRLSTKLNVQQEASMRKKHYRYHFDEEKKEHVIFVPQVKVNQIDLTAEVKTNSLAVKLLERITSYFYDAAMPEMADLSDPNAIAPSIQAHELEGRHIGKTSSKFIAEVLSMGHRSLSLEEVNKYAKVLPAPPFYLGLDWGEKDRYGRTDGRHAVRLDSIDNIHVRFANPWDNQEIKSMRLDDLETRNPAMNIFYHSPQARLLMSRLVKILNNEEPTIKNSLFLSDEHAEVLIKHPDLYQKLFNIHEKIGISNEELYQILFVQAKLNHMEIAPLLTFATKEEFAASMQSIQALYEKVTVPKDYELLRQAFNDAVKSKGPTAIIEGLKYYFKGGDGDLSQRITRAGGLREVLTSTPYKDELAKWSSAYNDQKRKIENLYFKLDKSKSIDVIKQEYEQALRRLHESFAANSRTGGLIAELPTEIAMLYSDMIQALITEKKSEMRSHFNEVMSYKNNQRDIALGQFAQAFREVGSQALRNMSNAQMHIYIEKMLDATRLDKFPADKYGAVKNVLQQENIKEYVLPWLIKLHQEYMALVDHYEFEAETGTSAPSLESQLQVHIDTINCSFPSQKIQKDFLGKLPADLQHYFDTFINDFKMDLVSEAQKGYQQIKNNLRTYELKATLEARRAKHDGEENTLLIQFYNQLKKETTVGSNVITEASTELATLKKILEVIFSNGEVELGSISKEQVVQACLHLNWISNEAGNISISDSAPTAVAEAYQSLAENSMRL